MPHIAYVNGAYVPHREASVHIEDRGFQFADGVYEYIAFYNQKCVDERAHLERLTRSLKELSIPFAMREQALSFLIREVIARSARESGGVYIQVTRGAAKRDHPFPKSARPTLVITVCGPKTPKPEEVEKGVRVITRPDIRWGRCDIKTVGLLANVLAKQEASTVKAREAWLVKSDGMVTEGAVSNAYIVTEKEGVITHPPGPEILNGVTRMRVLELARGNGIKVSERPFNLHELQGASEAFITSTSANVLPVVKVDDKVIGSGKPGPVSRRLLQLYLAHIKAETGA